MQQPYSHLYQKQNKTKNVVKKVSGFKWVSLIGLAYTDILK